MSDIAIRVENLSKQYRLGERESYKALRDVIADAAAAPFRRVKSAFNTNGSSNGSALSTGHSALKTANSKLETPNSIWALDDVSFEVKQGEVVGIIGRNGAGKSTLLKILSRITKPTKGHAKIYGRVGSLLEVGTGFHPELTGRENIYLNGAILGMRKAEIERKFDEIVAFAEVEKFIDTPVKRYSSGMYVRLAFAVAAHMETEILIIDEVLAVGDAQFQKKCLGKMGDAASQGRTVLFVSHQLNQIRRLSHQGIWLDSGGLKAIGPILDVVSAYESSGISLSDSSIVGRNAKAGAQFLKWEIIDAAGRASNVLDTFGRVKVRFELRVDRRIVNGHHGVALMDGNGQTVWGTGVDGLSLNAGSYDIFYDLSGLPLKPGIYSWLVTVLDNDQLLDSWSCLPEMIVATEPTGHRRDECAGILNFPYDIKIASRGDANTKEAFFISHSVSVK